MTADHVPTFMDRRGGLVGRSGYGDSCRRGSGESHPGPTVFDQGTLANSS